MSVNERKMDRGALRATAERHLKEIGMQRYGWLHPDLQVALHTAHKKGKITNEHLTALGDLFKATTVERMKPHLAKATEIAKHASGQEALNHLMRTVNRVITPPLHAEVVKALEEAKSFHAQNLGDKTNRRRYAALHTAIQTGELNKAAKSVLKNAIGALEHHAGDYQLELTDPEPPSEKRAKRLKKLLKDAGYKIGILEAAIRSTAQTK